MTTKSDNERWTLYNDSKTIPLYTSHSAWPGWICTLSITDGYIVRNRYHRLSDYRDCKPWADAA